MVVCWRRVGHRDVGFFALRAALKTLRAIQRQVELETAAFEVNTLATKAATSSAKTAADAVVMANRPKIVVRDVWADENVFPSDHRHTNQSLPTRRGGARYCGLHFYRLMNKGKHAGDDCEAGGAALRGARTTGENSVRGRES